MRAIQGETLMRHVGWLLTLPARAIEPVMAGLQKILGVRRLPWIFLLPNLLVILLFSMLPVLINVFYSVTGSDNLYPGERHFVGLSNYSTLLECGSYLDPSTCSRDLFWRAVRNTMLYVPLQVTVMIVIAMITALALNRQIRARGFFRGIFFFPVMLSPVVVAMTWVWLLQRDGALNGMLGMIGFARISWLTDPSREFMWSIFVTVWAHMGFYMVILLAGLQSIPADIYEAARMDRASPWRVFTRITLPLLKPVLLVVFILAVIRSVQTFDEIYVLTGGGPGTATKLIVHYIYETGFATMPRNYGLAAAASLMLGLVLFMFTALQMKLARRGKND